MDNKIINDRKCLFILACAILLVSSSAQAIVVYDPSNFLQNRISALNSVKMLLNQTEDVRYQLSIYQNDLKNSMPYSAGVWRSSLTELNKLADIAKQGNALAYSLSKLDETFKQRFPGVVKPQDYNKSYAGWSNTALDTLRTTLLSASTQANQFADEEQSKMQVQQYSDQAQGQMQALQAANMFAAQQIGQLQQMRQLLISQINAQNTYFAYQLAKDQAMHASLQEWLTPKQTSLTQYGHGSGFGMDDLRIR